MVTPTPHVGPMGINSPGYAPRPGTPAGDAADKWTKEYWNNLFKNRENINGVSVRNNV